MNTVAALSSNSSLVWQYIDALWDMGIPEGDDRDSDRCGCDGWFLPSNTPDRRLCVDPSADTTAARYISRRFYTLAGGTGPGLLERMSSVR